MTLLGAGNNALVDTYDIVGRQSTPSRSARCWRRVGRGSPGFRRPPLYVGQPDAMGATSTKITALRPDEYAIAAPWGGTRRLTGQFKLVTGLGVPTAALVWRRSARGRFRHRALSPRSRSRSPRSVAARSPDAPRRGFTTLPRSLASLEPIARGRRAGRAARVPASAGPASCAVA